MRRQSIGVFILAKNEAANIRRSLDALIGSGWSVHVLDSGSTDDTQGIAASYPDVQVHDYQYVDHCQAYNQISCDFAKDYALALVLDADMVVTPDLQQEIVVALNTVATWDALRAPIEMCVEGQKLFSGSLCPAKPLGLRTGRPWFEKIGHAEKLVEGTRVLDLSAPLIHDDRKDYRAFLLSQSRYAENLVARHEQGAVSGRDKLRIRTPLLIAAVPFVSYIVRRGFLSGRAGLLYALDRLIAEAIMYRYALAKRMLKASTDKHPD